MSLAFAKPQKSVLDLHLLGNAVNVGLLPNLNLGLLGLQSSKTGSNEINDPSAGSNNVQSDPSTIGQLDCPRKGAKVIKFNYENYDGNGYLVT